MDLTALKERIARRACIDSLDGRSAAGESRPPRQERSLPRLLRPAENPGDWMRGVRPAGRSTALRIETEARLGELEAAYAAAEQQRKAREASIDITLPGKETRSSADAIPSRSSSTRSSHLFLPRLFGCRGAGHRARVLQFRSPQHAQGPPRPGHAGYLLRRPPAWCSGPTPPRSRYGPWNAQAPHTDHRARRGLPARSGHLPHAHVPSGRGPDGGQEREVLRPERAC